MREGENKESLCIVLIENYSQAQSVRIGVMRHVCKMWEGYAINKVITEEVFRKGTSLIYV